MNSPTLELAGAMGTLGAGWGEPHSNTRSDLAILASRAASVIYEYARSQEHRRADFVLETLCMRLQYRMLI